MTGTQQNINQTQTQLQRESDYKKTRSSTGKRKYHQKSRNGCSTCKKRRVKCDEAKPECDKCKHMDLVCGYLLDAQDDSKSDEKDDPQELEVPSKMRKLSKTSSISSNSPISSPDSLLETGAQHRSPSLTPSPLLDEKLSSPTDPTQLGSLGSNPPPSLASMANNLLNAGNLNNINLSHLVNNLSGLGGDLSSLGNLANLSNLATLANLPIDLSNLGSLMDSANIPQQPQQQNHHHQQQPQPQQQQQNPPQPQYSATPQSNTHKKQFTNSNQPVNNETSNSLPNISPNVNTSIPSNPSNPMNNPMASAMASSNLNMMDLRLMFHYTSQVSNTITGAGISDTNIWNYDIPMLAFDYPFLMHSILAFSATHLSRTEKGLDQCVTCHRGDALRLLREAVLDINSDNTDALVASAIILIMDSLANASFPSSTSPKSLPASAWIFHVKGAATILTAVWPLTEASRFYKFISVDLGDLGDIINQRVNLSKDSSSDKCFTDLECHDSDIADLFPVEIDSPYLITLAYLNKLHKERYKSDFILRIFAFPALLDKQFLSLLMTGDIKAMRIMRSYYKLLRSFTTELKDKVWFLEGVSQVLPVDVEEYAGGAGGMHMMLDFLGGGPSIVDNEIDDEITKFDPTGLLTNKLIDPNNLPSDITSSLEVMQGDNVFMNMK